MHRHKRTRKPFRNLYSFGRDRSYKLHLVPVCTFLWFCTWGRVYMILSIAGFLRYWCALFVWLMAVIIYSTHRIGNSTPPPGNPATWEIWPVDSHENYWNCCLRISHFKGKMPYIYFRLWLRPRPRSGRSRAARYHQHCVNGDRLSQWEMANFGPLQNPNLWTDWQKIVTVDYVRETTRSTNFGANPSTGGFWANGWNITLNYFYICTYTFFRGTTHRSDPSTDFDEWWLKTHEITQGCAFWGYKK